VLANGYVEELLKLTKVLAVSEASQRRMFFEVQLAQARENLTKTEVAAREGLERGGLVKIDDQGRAMVEVTARLRGQITVKEVQIGGMRTYAADENPDLKMIQRELAALKHELAKIEGEGGAKPSPRVVNGRGMDSMALLRDMKANEVVVELLARQYELAKIDESKDPTLIQVLDKAVAPEFKSKPNRRNIVLLSALVALFAGVLWAFVIESLIMVRNDSQQVERLRILKRHLGWRSVA
jgi:uncharacterized protein involved in exopolysaccharide biosynthesis